MKKHVFKNLIIYFNIYFDKKNSYKNFIYKNIKRNPKLKNKNKY